MSKFNSVTKGTKTTNLAGGEAFTESPKLALVSHVLTSFVNDQFYRSAEDGLQELRGMIGKSDSLFVAKLALYARLKFGLRSVSHVLAAEVARTAKGQEWTKNFFDKIIYRPDDMTEILAYYYEHVAKNEPNALRKGFKKAFARFDAYKLGKYRGEGKGVSLVDVANVVHPAHTEAVASLIKGQLKQTETWESQLSSGKDKAQVWSDLLSENKLGYFALLRNLRNILETVPGLIDKVCEVLTNEQLISKSLVMPFRFIAAMDAISEASLPTIETRKILQAINTAVDYSLKNVPAFDGSTLVVVDASGSMTSDHTSAKCPIKIASIFAAALYKSNAADLMLFDDDAKYHNYNPGDSVMGISGRIIREARGGSTNFKAPFDIANKVYDRIIILSDMQGWVGYDAPTRAFADYKKRTGANPKIYSFDLTGHGTLQFPEPQVFCLAGFSEKVFDIMKLLEQDKNALVNAIESVEL